MAATNLIITPDESLKKELKFYNSNLKLITLNCQNLNSKREVTNELINNLGYNCIYGFTETWLTKDNDSKLWSFKKENFECFRCDRSQKLTKKAKGGGVLLLAPKTYRPKQRKDLYHPTNTLYESLWVEVKVPKLDKTILINVSYNPNVKHSADFLEELSKAVDSAAVENKLIYIMGDFNLNYLRSDHKAKLESCLSPYNLYSINKTSATRISKQSKSLLDYIWGDKAYSTKSFVAEAPLKTDHLMTVLVTSLKNDNKATTSLIRYHDKTNYDKAQFCEDLTNQDWSPLYTYSNVNETFLFFISMFSWVLGRHAPLKEKFVKNHSPKIESYYDEKANTLRKTKNRALKSYLSVKTSELFDNYKRARNKLNNYMKYVSQKHNLDFFEERHSERKKWKLINSLRNTCKNDTSIQLIANEKGCFTSNKDIADELNNIFISLGDFSQSSHQTNFDEYLNHKPEMSNKSFSFRFFTEKECWDAVKSLNKNKSSGVCPVTAWSLWDSSSILITHLSFLMNSMVYYNEFPLLLKQALVTPIHKDGDRSDGKNYRPISITSALAKVAEKLLLSQLNEFLETNEILSTSQFGFRKKVSCHDALLYATESFRIAMDKGDFIACAFLDLSKAFDSLDHKILMDKLRNLNFNDDSLCLIGSYLTTRQQRTKVNGTMSNWLVTKQGVPQGTILGPLLFSLYVNSLNCFINSSASFLQYADDTSIFVVNKDPYVAISSLEANIEKTLQYFQQHKLKVNPDKTQFLVLSKKSLNKKIDGLTLKVGSKTIELSCDVKFLGIWLDRNLTFAKQVNSTLQKMAQGITTLKEILPSLPPKARINLMKAICLSHLQYPAVLLTGILSRQIESIDRQINWAVKTANRIPKYSHVSKIKLKQKVLSAKNFITYRSLVYFANLACGSLPIFEKLSFPREFRSNRRTKTFSTIGKINMNILEKSFLETSIKSFNSLPIEIRSTLGSKKFKGLILDHFLLQEPT